MAMLLIIEPLAFVVGAISMRIRSHAFSFVIDPLTFIDVAISMHKFSLSIGLIIAPLTLVSATIRPELCAHPISHAIEPLTRVSRTISQCEGALGHTPKFISLLIGGHLRNSFAEYTTSLTVTIICASSILVFKVIMLIVIHVLFRERLTDLIILFLILPIAVTRTISHTCLCFALSFFLK